MSLGKVLTKVLTSKRSAEFLLGTTLTTAGTNFKSLIGVVSFDPSSMKQVINNVLRQPIEIILKYLEQKIFYFSKIFVGLMN